jgi:hypothetical protein
MEILVEVKSVYGKQLMYPVCDAAKLFASINGYKTLGPSVLADIKALGYTINVQIHGVIW